MLAFPVLRPASSADRSRERQLLENLRRDRPVPPGISEEWQRLNPADWGLIRELLTARDGGWRAALVRWGRWSGLEVFRVTSADEDRAWVARMVGSWRAEAIPLAETLVEALRQSGTPAAQHAVEEALLTLGDSGVEALAKGLRGADPGSAQKYLGVISRLVVGYRDERIKAEVADAAAPWAGAANAAVAELSLRILLHCGEGGTGLAPALTALRHPAPEVRVAAADLVGARALDPVRCVPLLRGALRDTDVLVRVSAAVALGRFGSSAAESIPDLMDAATDRHDALSLAAIRSLGRMGSAAGPAIPALLSTLQRRTALLRSASAAALGNSDAASPEVIRGLARALEDPETDVRRQAAQSLGKLGPRALEGIDALIRILADSSESVRVAAADALGSIGPGARRALPFLQAARNNNQSVMNRPVLAAVARIEGAEPLSSGHTRLAPEDVAR